MIKFNKWYVHTRKSRESYDMFFEKNDKIYYYSINEYKFSIYGPFDSGEIDIEGEAELITAPDSILIVKKIAIRNVFEKFIGDN